MSAQLAWNGDTAHGPNGSWFFVMCMDATAGGKVWLCAGHRRDKTWFGEKPAGKGVPAVVAADEADARERCRVWAESCCDA